MVDLIEYKIPEWSLEMLLIDKTTKRNILWASNNYKKYGEGFFVDNEMKYSLIRNNNIKIQPRINKNTVQQKNRTKLMGEIFTPAWICNKQNNLIDDSWFGYIGAFNVEEGSSWIPTDKVLFHNDNDWKKYVDEERIEIACGEAPYLVSRYDSTTGLKINLNYRIGLLDRKFRVINENANTIDEWIKYAKIALKRIYGFDYQGDNVFIARVNILMTFFDNYYCKYNVPINDDLLKEIIDIIVWNIWQMDGTKFVIPNSCHKEYEIQLSFFDDELDDMCYGCKYNDYKRHNGEYCKIKDWKINKVIKFVDLI